MAVNPSARGLTALRLFLGVFFLFEGIGKIGWLLDPSPLTTQLTGYLQNANQWNRAYLETVCLPGAAVFARLVLFGELATGVSFILGAYARFAAIAAFLMVLNIHFASGALFQYRFLTNGYGLPVLGGLLALALGGAALPLSLRK
ncbi:MAG: DoxX family membrane protein [Acidobacteria bacterium]|nr:DoxX family membrane protein [Acidobacteriota bacterium]